jgi:two-component system, chemotaxis family, chemotaxis protein CheY
MRILIVDDEMAALTKMKVLLAAYGECVLAPTAQQALQLYAAAIQESAPFDLITIDIHLGDTNGLNLLEALNRLENQHALGAAKKLMVTASGTKDNLIRALIKGCDGFLVKPVKRDTLAEKMSALGFAPTSHQPVGRPAGSSK